MFKYHLKIYTFCKVLTFLMVLHILKLSLSNISSYNVRALHTRGMVGSARGSERICTLTNYLYIYIYIYIYIYLCLYTYIYVCIYEISDRLH